MNPAHEERTHRHDARTLRAGGSPIPGINGELTGYWFVDVFAYMNLALITGLLFASTKGDSD